MFDFGQALTKMIELQNPTVGSAVKSGELPLWLGTLMSGQWGFASGDKSFSFGGSQQNQDAALMSALQQYMKGGNAGPSTGTAPVLRNQAPQTSELPESFDMSINKVQQWKPNLGNSAGLPTRFGL